MSANLAMLNRSATKGLLNPAGTKPVMMESPCPYAQWDPANVSGLGGAWTASPGSYVYTFASSSGVGLRQAMMLYDGNGTLNLTLAKTGSMYTWLGRVQTLVGGVVADTAEWTSTVGTLTLAVPYARYRLAIRLQAAGAAAGDTLSLSVTLT